MDQDAGKQETFAPPGESPMSGLAADTPHCSRFWTLAMLAWVAVWTLAIAMILDHPFNREFDWNAGMYGSAARNLVNEGFGVLRGGVYILPGEFPLEDRDFYAGHPPLMTWMLAGWMAMFGDSEVAVRAMPLATSALNLILLYFLVSRVFSPPAGLAATVICSLLPMTAFFAQSLNMEWFTTTAMLGAALAYLRWARCGCRWAAAALLACVVLGCWMDWPMYIFSGLLGGLHWLGKHPETNHQADAEPQPSESKPPPRRPWAMSAALMGVPVLMFFAFIVYASINGSGIGELLYHAKVRTGLMASGEVAATASEHKPSSTERFVEMIALRSGDSLKDSVNELRDWILNYFTLPALFLAGIGTITWRWWSRRLADDDRSRRIMFRLLVTFIVTQAIYTLAFPDGALRHNYWNYYLIVPVSILAAGLCVALTVTGNRRNEQTSCARLGIGFLDRAAWAVAATIPLFVVPTMRELFRKNPHTRDWERISYAQPLRAHTTTRDAIFTDRRVGYALTWYANRMVFYNRDFLSLDSLTRPRPVDGVSWVEAYSEPGRRLLFLWENARDDEASARFYDDLRARFGEPYRADQLTFFVLHGEPNADWKQTGISPATTPSTAPTTMSPVEP